MSNTGWIGVDLDGTLAKYDGWKHHTHIGDPIVPMVSRVQQWLLQGIPVKIFTARVSCPCPIQKAEVVEAIQQWALTHIGSLLEVTCQKDFSMIELWDDRARQVVFNEGIEVKYQPSSDW